MKTATLSGVENAAAHHHYAKLLHSWNWIGWDSQDLFDGEDQTLLADVQPSQ